MKMGKHRQIAGFVLVLAAFLLIGIAVHSLLPADDTTDPQPLQKAWEETGERTDDENGEIDDGGDGEIQTVTFDKIDSVLIYEIPEGIAERLNVLTFDKALTTYLKKKNLIVTSSGEENPSGLYTVKADGLLTEDVNRNVFFFDITIDNEQKSMITVTAGEDGAYTFSQ